MTRRQVSRFRSAKEWLADVWSVLRSRFSRKRVPWDEVKKKAGLS